MKHILFWLRMTALTVLPAAAVFYAGAGNRVVVSKPLSTLSVISASGDTLMSVPCCVGLNPGQKMRPGDMKTPEGTFGVSMIQDSRKWTHDFGDGAGKRRGAYGPWFIRLEVPWATGIGIHGTCFPETMGQRASEGCVRLLNNDVERLVKLIGVGTEVTIEPDPVPLHIEPEMQLLPQSTLPLLNHRPHFTRIDRRGRSRH